MCNQSRPLSFTGVSVDAQAFIVIWMGKRGTVRNGILACLESVIESRDATQ